MRVDRLGALLALRRREEELAARRAGEALKRAWAARVGAERAAAALLAEGNAAPGTAAFLLGLSRRGARLRLEAARAEAAAAEADRDSEAARDAQAVARARRELVDRARARWEAERRRAQDRIAERELDDRAPPRAVGLERGSPRDREAPLSAARSGPSPARS